MKKKKRATVETEKIEEKNTAQERSRVSIRVGQRTIISLIVAVSDRLCSTVDTGGHCEFEE
mgnify:CR=1 FL=1